MVLHGPARVAWRSGAGPGMCWDLAGGDLAAWEPDACDLR
jgi:hypothetical protein